MLGVYVHAALLQIQIEQELVRKMRDCLTPEQFEKWQAERAAERRHRELCDAIEQAGRNARPRGLGIFW